MRIRGVIIRTVLTAAVCLTIKNVFANAVNKQAAVLADMETGTSFSDTVKSQYNDVKNSISASIQRGKEAIEEIVPPSLIEHMDLFSNAGSEDITETFIIGRFPDDKETLDNAADAGTLELHVIDVGQGDSILLKQGEHAALIDAGNNDKGDTVVSYLESHVGEEIDYFFITHPDADHCGGADNVIENMDVRQVVMPCCENDTYTYGDVLEAIDSKGIDVIHPDEGSVFLLGDAEIKVLTSDKGKTYDDTNDCSLVLYATFEESAVLLMGDASTNIEMELLQSGMNLQADILKAGHHGSYSSTSEEFLSAVGAEDGVIISAGAGNEYGHPHEVVMDRIEEMGLPIYRTDLQGNLVCTMDEGQQEWDKEDADDYRSGNEINGH